MTQNHYTTAFQILFLKRSFQATNEVLELFLRSKLNNYSMKMNVGYVIAQLTRTRYMKGLVHAGYHDLQFKAPQIASTLNIKVETVYYHLRQQPDVTLNLFNVVDQSFLVTRQNDNYIDTL